MSASDHSLTVLGNGKVVASGFNNYAQCGISDGGLEPTDCPQGPEANVRAPAMVTHAELSASHVIASAEGGWHSLLIAEKFDQRPTRGTSDMSKAARVSPGEHVVWSVGRNARGQCGCSTNTPAVTTPRRVAFFEGKGLRVNQIQAGGHYTVVMMDKMDADVDSEMRKNAAEKAARVESMKIFGDHPSNSSPTAKRRKHEHKANRSPSEADSDDAATLSRPSASDGAMSSAGAGQVSWSASSAAAATDSEGAPAHWDVGAAEAENFEPEQLTQHFNQNQFLVSGATGDAAEPPVPPTALQPTAAAGPAAPPHVVPVNGIVRCPTEAYQRYRKDRLVSEQEEDEIGQIYVFGSHKHGQLGLGRDSSSSPGHCNTPTRLRIPGLPGRRIRNIACGESHTIVVGVEGELFIWGWNNHGQLGLGDFQNRSEPQRLKFNSHLRKMHVERRRHASGSHAKSEAKTVAGSCIAMNNDAMAGPENTLTGSGLSTSTAACGGGAEGSGADAAQCTGTAGAETDTTLNSVGLSSRSFAKASVRGKHKRKSISDKDFDFGKRLKHALRREGHERELSAEYMLARTRMVACGTEHTLVLTDDDELYSFGRGDNGQLGFHDVDSSSGLKEALSGTDKPMDQTTPRWLSSMSYRGLSHIACGGRFSFAVQVVGAKPAAEHAPAPGFAGTGGDPPRDMESGSVRVWGWGDNSRGQLGIGPTCPSFLHTAPNSDDDADVHADNDNEAVTKPRVTKWISAECACCSRPMLFSGEAEQPTFESEHDRDQQCWAKHSAQEAFPESSESTQDAEITRSWHVKMVWRPHVIRTLSCQSHGGGASIGGGRVRQIFPRWQSTFVLTTEDVVFGFGRNDYGQLGASHAHDAKSNVLAPVRLNILSGKGVMLATGQGDAAMDLMQQPVGDDQDMVDDDEAALDIGGEGGSYGWFRWFAGLTAMNEDCRDGTHVAEMSAREAPVLALHRFGSHTRHGLGRKLLRLGRRCHEFDSTSVDLGTLLIQSNARGGDFGDCSDVRKYRWTPCELFGADEDNGGATDTTADAVGWADAILVAGRDRSRFAVHRAVIESRCPAFATLLRNTLLRRERATCMSGAATSVGSKRARNSPSTLVRLDNCTQHEKDTSTSKTAQDISIEDSTTSAPPFKRQRASPATNNSRDCQKCEYTGSAGKGVPLCATIDGIDGYQLSALLVYIYSGRLWPLPNVQCEEDFRPISVPPIEDCDDPAQLIAHERAKKREYAASKIRPFEWALGLALAADRFNLADLSVAVRDRLKSSITIHSAIFLICALSNINCQAQNLGTATSQLTTTNDGNPSDRAVDNGEHFNELKIACYSFLRQRWKSVVAANPTLLAEVIGAVNNPGLLGEVFALSSAQSDEDAFRQIGITDEPRRPPPRTNRHPLHVDILGMLRRANPLDTTSVLPEGCINENGWAAHHQEISIADTEVQETLQQIHCEPDVTVQIGDHSFRCHSVILVARSAFFASALRTASRQRQFNDDSEMTIRVTHDPMPSKRVFMIFLQYLYAGATMSFAKQLDLPMALELERLAPFFMLRTRHLTSMCLQVIRSGMTPASALTLMSAAPSLCRDDLKDAATEYVLRNASKLSNGRSNADFVRFVSDSPVVAGSLLRKSLSALGAARDESKLSIAEAVLAKRKAVKVETELKSTRTALKDTQEKLKNCSSHEYTFDRLGRIVSLNETQECGEIEYVDGADVKKCVFRVCDIKFQRELMAHKALLNQCIGFDILDDDDDSGTFESQVRMKAGQLLELPQGTAAIAGAAGLAAADEDKGQDTSTATASGQSRSVAGGSSCRNDLSQEPSSPPQTHQLDSMSQNDHATSLTLPSVPQAQSHTAAPVIEDSTENAQN